MSSGLYAIKLHMPKTSTQPKRLLTIMCNWQVGYAQSLSVQTSVTKNPDALKRVSYFNRS